ncbi:LTA synthase family protein [Porphyromonas crevioricanis]|uniref:Lipoteichoic acid synthase 1 n=1 Tax=Porphyromonas crevioricanis TaxID=393921 RepID=A0A2X4PKY8_9PORP|nr:LTA synthase family protein [Porphyromonas crevioricanis]GAD08299.1 hypothetical protein PORCAN_1937 [Porphyromonas crevioricanis JCM 13913]SQH73005.1 Lipoteichoic acid synthase 1 [Porphyromonas crevioricanis]
MNKFYFKTSYRSVCLLYNLLLSLVFLNIGRLVFALYNHDYYQHLSPSEVSTAWLGGLRFDASAMAYLCAPFVLVFLFLAFLPNKVYTHKISRRVLRWSFFIPNAMGVILNVGDSGYFPYVLRRTTMSVFQEFSNDSVPLIMGRLLVQYYGLTLLGVGLVFLLWWMTGRVRFQTERESSAIRRIVGASLGSLLIALLFVGAMRGGWAHSLRPITLSNASLYVENTKDRDLVLNTPFCLIRTMGKRVLKEVEYIPQEKAQQLFNGVYQAAPTTDSDSLFGAYRGYNVMIFIVESFSKEHIGALQEDGRGFSPFIDSLIRHEDVLSFPYAFANGRKSIDAMPSILTSVPALGTNFVTSHYSGNEVLGMPRLLSSHGYQHTVFMHGAPNGSMGFDAFAKQVGFREYYGMNEYPEKNDFDGTWGIWDKPFLLQSADELSHKPTPWMACLFTLSNHAPFKVPKEDEGCFPLGSLPQHQCVGYTDSAFKAFFEKAKQQEWYYNTLFVFTADHASQSCRPEYQNTPGSYAVPMLWFAPGKPLTRYHIDTNTIVQQADIYPSINYLLGIEERIVAFGQNMFDPKAPHYALCFDGDYKLMSADRVVSLKESGELKSEHLQTPLLPDTENSVVPDKFLPAVVQNYNSRLIHNRLIQK